MPAWDSSQHGGFEGELARLLAFSKGECDQQPALFRSELRTSFLLHRKSGMRDKQTPLLEGEEDTICRQRGKELTMGTEGQEGSKRSSASGSLEKSLGDTRVKEEKVIAGRRDNIGNNHCTMKAYRWDGTYHDRELQEIQNGWHV